jgi:hypothetical protein
MQIFTEHEETTPLALMLKDNVSVNAPLDFIKPQKHMEVEKLSKTMKEIHAQEAEKSTHDRKDSIQKQNEQDARAVAEHSSRRLRGCGGTLQER